MRKTIITAAVAAALGLAAGTAAQAQYWGPGYNGYGPGYGYAPYNNGWNNGGWAPWNNGGWGPWNNGGWAPWNNGWGGNNWQITISLFAFYVSTSHAIHMRWHLFE